MSAQINTNTDRLLTPSEAAYFLGLSTQTLAKWRCHRSQPLRFTKAGRLVRYRLADLQAYAEARCSEGAKV